MNFFGKNPRFKSGEVVYRAGGRLGPRIQRNLQLVYVYHGNMRVRTGERKRVVEAGEAALLVPGKEERFAFSAVPTCHHGWVEVLQPRLDPSVRQRYELLWKNVPFSPRMRELTGMISQVDGANRTAPFHLHQCLAQAIFFEFFDLAGFGDEEDNLPVPVEKAKSRIARDYGNNLTLRDLASSAGVTGQHLGRLFRRALDKSPVEDLWEFRVQEGVRLLEETGLNISEIADRCGFRTPFHFSRLVRQHCGHPPRELRRRHWSERQVHSDRVG